MNQNQIIETLGLLMLMDFDAAHAYEEAIENIKDSNLSNQFTLFRKDHQNHVFKLAETIRSMGENPPPHSNDYKEYIHKDFISPKQITDVKQLLEAMKKDEQMVSDIYTRAMKMDLPENVRSLVESNFHDEERHIAFIESTLELSPVAR